MDASGQLHIPAVFCENYCIYSSVESRASLDVSEQIKFACLHQESKQSSLLVQTVG